MYICYRMCATPSLIYNNNNKKITLKNIIIIIYYNNKINNNFIDKEYNIIIKIIIPVRCTV